MITKKPREKVISEGEGLTTSLLKDQANHTLKQVAADPPVAARLGAPLLAEIAASHEAVNRASSDRELAQFEAEFATAAKADYVQETQVYLHEIKYNADEASAAGEEVPESLLTIGTRSKKPTVLSLLVCNRVALVEPLVAVLAPYGLTAEFVARGLTLAGQLDNASGDQSQKRLLEVPDKVREHWYQKGLLHCGLKRINAAGRSVHARDKQAARSYNLNLLYAKSAKRNGTPKP